MRESLWAPPDQGEQGQGVEDGQHEGGAGVLAEGAGQLGDAVGDQGQAGDGLEAQQDDRDEGVMETEARRPAGQHEEERAVGGGRVEPEAIDRVDVGPGAQRARTVVVRVDVVAHHFALGGVGEHVAAEQRGHDHQRHQPQGQHVGQLLDGDVGPRPQRAVQAEPDPHEEDHAAVHGDHAGQEKPGRVVVVLAEEPGAGHLELEGRAGQRGADADGQDGHEAEDGGPAQPGPVVGVHGVGLDALGQGPGGAEPHPQGLVPHGQAAQARLGPVQDAQARAGGGRHRGVGCAVVHVSAGVSVGLVVRSSPAPRLGSGAGRARRGGSGVGPTRNPAATAL